MKCKKKVKKIRRCEQDRWDFTSEDNIVFPIKLGNSSFGFCPGKISTDYETQSLYDVLVLSFETRTMLVSGGIIDQPYWYNTLLPWFIEIYDLNKFANRVTMVMGESDEKGKI